MPHKVFICYATHDRAVAEAICAALESRQIKCWIAPRDVLPGTEWAETIVDALDGSRVLVLVLSSNSNTSPQVIREVGRAAGNGTPIMSIRIDDVVPSKAMDYFISSHQWLDAQTGPLEKHLQRLTDTVQQILARKRVPRDAIERAEADEARRARALKIRLIKESVVINQPVSKVFDYVINKDNDHLWQTNVVEAQLTSQGPIGVGSNIRWVQRFLGKRFESNFEVVEFEPNKICRFRSTSGPIKSEGSYTFEGVEGGTKFTQSIMLGEPQQGFFKIVDAISTKMYKRQLSAYLRNLKDLLEAKES
jgi:uncharacterized membrane protein